MMPAEFSRRFCWRHRRTFELELLTDQSAQIVAEIIHTRPPHFAIFANHRSRNAFGSQEAEDQRCRSFGCQIRFCRQCHRYAAPHDFDTEPPLHAELPSTEPPLPPPAAPQRIADVLQQADDWFHHRPQLSKRIELQNFSRRITAQLISAHTLEIDFCPDSKSSAGSRLSNAFSRRLSIRDASQATASTPADKDLPPSDTDHCWRFFQASSLGNSSATLSFRGFTRLVPPAAFQRGNPVPFFRRQVNRNLFRLHAPGTST